MHSTRAGKITLEEEKIPYVLQYLGTTGCRFNDFPNAPRCSQVLENIWYVSPLTVNFLAFVSWCLKLNVFLCSFCSVNTVRSCYQRDRVNSIRRCHLLVFPKYAVKIYIHRSNFEIVNKGPLRVSKLFFSAPNLAWMINDHLVANIAQYFNFLPSQRYLKGCTKFILTVCVVYNAVISDWLTSTKTFSINSTHSWRKPAHSRL